MNQTWVELLPHAIRKKFEGRQSLQGIIGNTGWLFADKIVRMGVGLLLGIWIARYLGPEQFGSYSYATAFVALFSTIASLGLDGIAVRNIVRDPLHKDEIIGTVFLLKLMGGGVAFAVAVASIWLVRANDPQSKMLVAIISAGNLFLAFDAIDFWFQARVESKYTVLAKNCAFLLLAAVKIVLIVRHAPLTAFAWAASGEVLIGGAGLLVAYQRISGDARLWRYSASRAKGLLHDSWPLIFSSIVIIIYMKIDQVMLGEMVGNREVGVYSVAVRLAEVWYLLPGAVVSSVFPSIVAAKESDEPLFYARLQKLYNVMAFMGYAIAIPMTFLGGWLVKLLFGVAYAKAGPMLALLIWAIIFTNLGVARSTFLTAMNWTRIHFVTVFLGCVINVALNLWLIPLYGGMGAVIASCVAYWFAAHGACFVYRPLFKTGWMLSKAILYPKIW